MCSSAGRERKAQTGKWGITMQVSEKGTQRTPKNEAEPLHTGAGRRRKSPLVNSPHPEPVSAPVFLKIAKGNNCCGFYFWGPFYRMHHRKQISIQQQGQVSEHKDLRINLKRSGCQGLELTAPVAPRDWLEAILSACLGIRGRGAWDACQLSPVKKASVRHRFTLFGAVHDPFLAQLSCLHKV